MTSVSGSRRSAKTRNSVLRCSKCPFSPCFVGVIINSVHYRSKCQKACQSLDLAAEVEKPQEEWYWPPKNEEQPANDSDEERNTASEESEYDSDSDLSRQGDQSDSDDDKIDKALRRRTKRQEQPEEPVEATNSVPIEDQVNALLSYLRTKYFYCVWCGIQYNDVEDLEEKCPGLCKDDH